MSNNAVLSENSEDRLYYDGDGRIHLISLNGFRENHSEVVDFMQMR